MFQLILPFQLELPFEDGGAATARSGTARGRGHRERPSAREQRRMQERESLALAFGASAGSDP